MVDYSLMNSYYFNSKTMGKFINRILAQLIISCFTPYRQPRVVILLDIGTMISQLIKHV